jgi:hypothetical protein
MSAAMALSINVTPSSWTCSTLTPHEGLKNDNTSRLFRSVVTRALS